MRYINLRFTLLTLLTASLLELYFNDSMQTVYACGGGGGSQQREFADGADVVFRDTGNPLAKFFLNKLASFSIRYLL